MYSTSDYVLKVAVCGTSGVGKTSLISVLARGKMPERERATLDTDVFGVRVVHRCGSAFVQLWDTVGDERLEDVNTIAYSGASGILLVYDVTCAETFTAMQSRFERVKHRALVGTPVVIVIGNKMDLTEQRQVRTDDVAAYCTAHGFSFMETSALTKQNTAMMFDELLENMIDVVNSRRLLRAQTSDAPFKIPAASVRLDVESRTDDSSPVPASCKC